MTDDERHLDGEGSVKELVEFLARSLVDNPDEVSVEGIEADDGIVYQLRVAESDMGVVIGRRGRTASALRAVIGAAGAKADQSVSLEIVD